MLCSVVKHLGSGRAFKKYEKHLTVSRVFAYFSFVLYLFLHALQQNRAQSKFLYLLSKTTFNFSWKNVDFNNLDRSSKSASNTLL